MEEEAKPAPGTYRSQMVAKIRNYRRDLDKLSRDLVSSGPNFIELLSTETFAEQKRATSKKCHAKYTVRDWLPAILCLVNTFVKQLYEIGPWTLTLVCFLRPTPIKKRH